ncbi:MAG: hypothetical protein ACRDG6_04470 [Candidatus Limnocylindria bacterium]
MTARFEDDPLDRTLARDPAVQLAKPERDEEIRRTARSASIWPSRQMATLCCDAPTSMPML